MMQKLMDFVTNAVQQAEKMSLFLIVNLLCYINIFNNSLQSIIHYISVNLNLLSMLGLSKSYCRANTRSFVWSCDFLIISHHAMLQMYDNKQYGDIKLKYFVMLCLFQ